MEKALRRYAMVDSLVSEEVPRGEKTALLLELSRQYHLSVSTLKRYLKKYEQERFDGLLPKEHRVDKGKSRAIPAEILKKAVELREEVRARSTEQIIAILDRLYPDYQGQVKRSTLARHFKQLGKTRQALRKEEKGYRRFQKRHRNDLWETDLCLPALQVRDADGQVKPAVLVAFIDDATRLCLAAEFHATQDAGVVESCFKKAVVKCGLPAAVYLDNGTQFVSEQITGACQSLGVRHLRAKPYYAEGKGKIERFWGTLQNSFVPEMQAMGMILSLQELSRYLWAWVEEYYHRRVHEELGETPLARWEHDPTPLRRVDAVTLEAAFLLKAERKVSKTSLVSLEGTRYLVDDSLAGRWVEVRYHPRECGRIQIWSEGRFIQYAEPYEIPTNVPRRPEPQPQPKPKTDGPNLVRMLAQEREAKLKARLESLRASGLPEPAPEPPFTETAFLTLLCTILERNLEPLESQWALQTWRKCGGLDRERTTNTLRRFIARDGLQKHLSYYLETITRAHLGTQKGDQCHV